MYPHGMVLIVPRGMGLNIPAWTDLDRICVWKKLECICMEQFLKCIVVKGFWRCSCQRIQYTVEEFFS